MTGDLFESREPYRCLLLDPPWAERGGGKIKRGADRHYDLAGKLGDAKPILDIVRGSGEWRPAANAHCWMWFTDNFLEDALWLTRELGFTYKRLFVWVKTGESYEDAAIEAGDPAELDGILRMGIGQYGRGCHEGMIFATRGSGQSPDVWTRNRSARSVFHAPHPTGVDGKRIHSRKPPKSYELIESVSRGPRIEFFARVPRLATDGTTWSVWGNQAPEVSP